jgi:hypothetical protein
MPYEQRRTRASVPQATQNTNESYVYFTNHQNPPSVVSNSTHFTTAVTSISISTPNGKLATPTVDLAGLVGKLLSNTAFTSLNAFRSVMKIPTRSTLLRSEPAASRIALMLATHARACSVMLPVTRDPSGRPGIWPETWMIRAEGGAIVAGD